MFLEIIKKVPPTLHDWNPASQNLSFLWSPAFKAADLQEKESSFGLASVSFFASTVTDTVKQTVF